MKYKLRNNFVFRKDEGIIFDSKKFLVHKMNEAGLMILEKISKDYLDLDHIHSSISTINKEDVLEFLDKATEAGFVESKKVV